MNYKNPNISVNYSYLLTCVKLCDIHRLVLMRPNTMSVSISDDQFSEWAPKTSLFKTILKFKKLWRIKNYAFELFQNEKIL